MTTPEDLGRLVAPLLEPSTRRTREQGMRLEVTDAAKELLLERSRTAHPPGAGQPSVASEVADRVASVLLSDEARPGDTIVVDVRDGMLVCTTAATQESEAEAAAESEGMPPPPPPDPRP